MLQGVFPVQGVVALAGSSDLGKSYLLQQLSVAVAGNSEEFIGFKLNIKVPSAIYVSTEDDVHSMCIRLNQLSRYIDKDGLPRLRFLFESTDLVRILDEELTIQPASLVVVDTFSDVFAGNLNDAIGVRQYIMNFKMLATKHQCLVIFNHHCSKRNDARAPSKDNLLGSQGFESSMRCVIELRQDPTDASLRQVCIVKGNNIASDFKLKSFEMFFSFEDGFVPTGNRVDFNELVTVDNKSNRDVQQRVVAQRNEGKSVRAITDLLNKQGIEIGKSKVAEIIKKQPVPAPGPKAKEE
jgi:predicted ATP-dependent serine protease